MREGGKRKRMRKKKDQLRGRGKETGHKVTDKEKIRSKKSKKRFLK